MNAVQAAPARRTRLWLLLAIVTAIRLAALPLRGTEDVLTWKIWAIAAAKNVTTVYGIGGHPPVRGEVRWLHHTTTVDYPRWRSMSLAPRGWCTGCSTPDWPTAPR